MAVVRNVAVPQESKHFLRIRELGDTYYVIVGESGDWYYVEQLSGRWYSAQPGLRIPKSRGRFADEVKNLPLYKERYNSIRSQYENIAN